MSDSIEPMSMVNPNALNELSTAFEYLTPSEFKERYFPYWYSVGDIEGVAMSLTLDGWYVFTMEGEVVLDARKNK